MSAIKWYARRLRTMQPRELLWRSAHAVSSAILVRRRTAELHSVLQSQDWGLAFEAFRAGMERPVLLDRQFASTFAERYPAYVVDVIAAADSAANLSFQFFGYPEVLLRRPIDWNYDPIAQQRWPDRASNRINHRTVTADVKWIWELNRLQHLPWLAQAWLFTGDDTYSRAAFEQLDSWIDQNPPGQGIAWRGAFEGGIRAISITIALQGLRDAPDLTPERFRRIVGVLAESAERCWTNRSQYSSANNHLVGEMAGLAVVAMMLPELPRSKLWRRRAFKALAREAQKQVLTDGAGAEQAISYQLFTVELIHLVVALSMQVDERTTDALVEAVVRSSSFLEAMVGARDPDTRYGDDDFGFALRLGAQPSRTVRDHLGIVSASGVVPGGVSTGCDSLDARWFATAARVGSITLLSDSTSPRATASFTAYDGGLVVLRAPNRRVTMDIGPLGYLSIAAHGHADALSVTLSHNGEDVISDPGTASYYGHPDWRAVMRGTRAHPTVCVDGENQSVAGGPFLWSRQATVTVRGIDIDAGLVDAQHDGYLRLPGRILHRRWLVAPPTERAQLVIDLLEGKGRHLCTQSWPLHPRLDAAPIPTGHLLSSANTPQYRLLYAATAKYTVEQVRGDSIENLGWWSDRLESRIPAWWGGCVMRCRLPLVMVTLICPADRVATEGLLARLNGHPIEIRWMEDLRERTVCVDTNGNAKILVDHTDKRGPKLMGGRASNPPET